MIGGSLEKDRSKYDSKHAKKWGKNTVKKVVLQLIKKERIEQKKEGREAHLFLVVFWSSYRFELLKKKIFFPGGLSNRRWKRSKLSGTIWQSAAVRPHKTLQEEERRLPWGLLARGAGAAPVWELSGT